MKKHGGEKLVELDKVLDKIENRRVLIEFCSQEINELISPIYSMLEDILSNEAQSVTVIGCDVHDDKIVFALECRINMMGMFGKVFAALGVNIGEDVDVPDTKTINYLHMPIEKIYEILNKSSSMDELYQHLSDTIRGEGEKRQYQSILDGFDLNNLSDTQQTAMELSLKGHKQSFLC